MDLLCLCFHKHHKEAKQSPAAAVTLVFGDAISPPAEVGECPPCFLHKKDNAIHVKKP